jgi:hypothetical protein
LDVQVYFLRSIGGIFILLDFFIEVHRDLLIVFVCRFNHRKKKFINRNQRRDILGYLSKSTGLNISIARVDIIFYWCQFK